MRFYTYLWLRADGSPYYVGKGTGDRAFVSKKRHRPPAKERIVVQYQPSEEAAFAEEIRLIAKYGRKDLGTGCLRNMSNGGVGGALTGAALEKMKISKAKQIYTHSPETKRKISAALKNKPKSPEHRLKIKTITSPAGGRANGRLAVENGWAKKMHNLPQGIAANRANGTKQGHINAQKPNYMRQVAHVRWHVNRGIVKPGCSLCFATEA